MREQNKTGFRGVTFRKNSNCYEARVRVKGLKNKIHIGYARTAEEAARLYDAKIIELYGVNADTNFEQS